MSSVGLAVSNAREDLALVPYTLEQPRSPHYRSEDSILIFLAVPGKQPMPIRIQDSDSIASVKFRIQRCQGFHVNNQRLVYDGRELARNDCLVRDYGLADGNFLYLVYRLSDLREIHVETAAGKKLMLQVEQNRTVSLLKKQITDKVEGLENFEDHKLLFDGEELKDHQLITDISKNNDSVIYLFIQRSAKVRPQQVDKDVEVTIVAPAGKNPQQEDNSDIQPMPLNESDLVKPVVVNPKAELPQIITEMINSTSQGLENGHWPVMSSEGMGGAYFMRDASGSKYVAVFKPTDEEPNAENNPRGFCVSTDGEGMKRGTRVGEGAFREVAAYLLDYPIDGLRTCDGLGFAGVPPTSLVQCLHGSSKGYGTLTKSHKIGSLQMFVNKIGSSEDMGSGAFAVEDVQRIAVLDIRLANADRHAGNILVRKEGVDGHVRLIPIDHGYCLPEKFEDCTFEWLYWPQSRKPFSVETIKYIGLLDAEADIDLLKFHGWELSPQCSRVLRVSTMLLKKGAEQGLTAHDIGRIMCRETLKKESEIEEILQEAEDNVLPGSSEATFLEAISEIMDRRLGMLRLL